MASGKRNDGETGAVMEQIICRHAKDDFEALLTAKGMASAGADVFSVVWTGRSGQLAYVVFAKYDAPITTEAIDTEIEKQLFGKSA